MDEAIRQKVEQNLNALRALHKSVERSLQQGFVTGTGKMAARNYNGLQRNLSEAMPDDFYVQSLALEISDNMDDEAILGQIQFAASQLVIYLEDQVKRSGKRVVIETTKRGDWDDIKHLGRDLQEQIVNVTRTTLRRALNDLDIDIDVQVPRPPVPPVPPTAPTPPNFVHGMSLRDANIAGRDFRGVRLDGVSMRDANAEGADFTGASLVGADLKRANLEGAIFVDAHAEGANLYEANVTNADFTRAQADGISFKHANIENSIFVEARMEGGNFVDANLGDSNFMGASCVGANFRNANLDNVNFHSARLSGANFRDANMDGVNMTGARLSGAVMPDGATYINGMDLSRYGIVVEQVAEYSDDEEETKRKNDEEQELR